MITLIITGAVVILFFIAGICLLIIFGKDANTLLAFVNLVGIGGIGSGMYYLLAKVRIVERNTNHTLDKLTDAVIAAPPPPVIGQTDGST
jgi:hypothetical protein